MNWKISALLGFLALTALLGGCAQRAALVKAPGMNAPGIKGAFIKDEFVFLLWGSVPGAASYDLHLACPGKETTRIAEISTPLYKGAAIRNPACSYEVVAVASDGSRSPPSKRIVPEEKREKEAVSCRLLVGAGKIDSYPRGGIKTRFSEPTDLVSVHGSLFVTDAGTRSIVILDPRGGAVRIIDAESLAYDGAWGTPWGIGASADEERVAVTFLDSRRVRVFSASGELLRDIEVPPPGGRGSVRAPHLMDVDIDDAGNLWVSDAANARIMKIDGDGTRLFEVDDTSPGASGRMIRIPTFLDCGTGTGSVRVVDPRSATTHAISREGKLIGNGEAPAAAGLQVPKGICRNREGEYLVVDGLLRNIQVYNSDGVLCSTYNREHLESLGIKAPVSLAVDTAESRLYILSKLYGAIHILRLTK